MTAFRQRARTGLMAASAAMLLLVGCTSTSRTDSGPAAADGSEGARGGCTTRNTALSPRLVPSCGALLGVTPPIPGPAGLAEAQRAAGRRFGLVYRFHDVNDVVPDLRDRAVLSNGEMLHVTIDSRDYASDDHFSVSWRSIAAGVHDAELRRQADGVRGIGRPVFMTFDHEPDQPAKAALGSPADFVAAWRHVHDLYEQEGATNAVWVWVVMGWPPTFSRALQMWPGNHFVDWIGWSAYDHAGCQAGVPKPALRESFGESALPFYRWLRRHGPQGGVDIDKPMMISEAGSALDASRPDATSAWFRSMSTVLRNHPAIKAVTMFDHVGSSPGCDYRFPTSAPGHTAVLHALRSDVFVGG